MIAMTEEPSSPHLEEVRAATNDMARARERRDAAIVQAAREGEYQADIAEAAGLSRMWVRRIVREANDRIVPDAHPPADVDGE